MRGGLRLCPHFNAALQLHERVIFETTDGYESVDRAVFGGAKPFLHSDCSSQVLEQ